VAGPALVAWSFALLLPGAAGAQITVTQAPAAPPAAVAPLDEQSAQDVRQRLNELLREIPPSVGQVLRLDPSLLTREGYLDPYPRLRAFVQQHPEITRSPSFYLGSAGFDRLDLAQEDANMRAVRVFGDFLFGAVVLCGFLAFFSLVGWIAYLIVDYRRWLRVSKTQTEAHSKLLDRLSSNDDLMAYIQSPAGQHFLQSAPMLSDSAPRAVGAPVNRILWSVQAGVVLALAGTGLWIAKNSVVEELTAPLNVFALLAIALGVGFALSAGVAYLLSLRLGLLEPPKS
jgi:hypothetical protein